MCQHIFQIPLSRKIPQSLSSHGNPCVAGSIWYPGRFHKIFPSVSVPAAGRHYTEASDHMPFCFPLLDSYILSGEAYGCAYNICA